LIVYLDSSVLARAYLPDEDGHEDVLRLLQDSDIGAVTGTWTRIEVSGALVRAAAVDRGDRDELLDLLDADLGDDGPVTVLSAPQADVEDTALEIVRSHALRAMDAWHVAVASLTVPALAEPDEPIAFASRDDAQAAVAESLGFQRL
jgi:predicted nucleic acid-binding protein